jgi:predicted CopG family antitoxin
MATVLVCLCGDPKPDHLMGKKACQRCRTCDAFELDGEVPTSRGVKPDPAPLAEPWASMAAAEPTAEKLRRVEQERDSLSALVDRLAARNRELLEDEERLTRERDEVRSLVARIAEAGGRDIADGTDVDLPTRVAELRRGRKEATERALELATEREQLRAALVQANDNAKRLGAATGWTVSHDNTSNGCEKCEQLIRRGEAYVPTLPGVGLYEHVICPDPATGPTCQHCRREIQPGEASEVDLTGALHIHTRCPDADAAPAAPLYAYDAWQCLVCGARYTVPNTDHPHPLTPVRVSITRKP